MLLLPNHTQDQYWKKSQSAKIGMTIGVRSALIRTYRKPRKRGGSAKKRGISNEQVSVLVARDRDKLTFSQTLEIGQLAKEQLDKAIGHKLSKENVLCTDAWRAFKTYATEKDISIYQFKSDGKIRTKGLYHNFNNYHRRLKGWIQRCPIFSHLAG